jgi:hypothetical protein
VSDKSRLCTHCGTFIADDDSVRFCLTGGLAHAGCESSNYGDWHEALPMKTPMRCARANADGSRCNSTRSRSVSWIKDPWDCGKHRKRGKALLVEPSQDPMEDHRPTEQDILDYEELLLDEQLDIVSHL